MHANDVLQLHGITFAIIAVAIEVLDMPQAIASERQLVGVHTKASVTNIKCLLAVIRRTGI